MLLYRHQNVGQNQEIKIANRSFENVSQRDEVTGEWRKFHNKELHDLYSSPSIIRIIKSQRMRWVGHVARMGEKRNAYRLWWERDH
jgi:hypothetical protein